MFVASMARPAEAAYPHLAGSNAWAEPRDARLSASELVASIAHEVNQPLSAMMANGQACLRWFDREVPDVAAARESVQRMLDNAARAVGIVATLNAMARGASPDREPIDVNDLLRLALSRVEEKIAEQDVAVSLELGNAIPRVSAGRIELEQVIVNLITNAVQAMSGISGPRRLTLVTRVARSERQVIIEVRDNGPGFATAHPGQVFEPFFTTKQAGMGMGLAICRAIVSGLGGRIDARNNETGGARLVVRLPADGAGMAQ